MTSAFIYSFREMKTGSEGSDGRRKKRQELSNGEDTSNTSKKTETATGRQERLSTCFVVNVSCKLRQECIMEVQMRRKCQFERQKDDTEGAERSWDRRGQGILFLLTDR